MSDYSGLEAGWFNFPHANGDGQTRAHLRAGASPGGPNKPWYKASERTMAASVGSKYEIGEVRSPLRAPRRSV